MATERALCIPIWFDAERGHEPNNKGKPIIRPLSWFIGRVHRGETVKKLVKSLGLERAARAVFVYDQACQWTASQLRERRGWILDRLGKPQTIEAMAREHEFEVAWLTQVIDDLCNCGWLSWRRFGTPLDRPKNGRSQAEKGPKAAESVRKKAVPDTDTESDPDTDSVYVSDPDVNRANGVGASPPGGNRDGLGRAALSVSEYEAAVKRRLFGLADDALCRRVIKSGVGIEALEGLLQEYREQPTPRDSSAYLHGMFQRRGILPKKVGGE